jgi:NAD(P)H-nitrite reductase large subunit
MRYVIIGSGAAGISAARTIRKHKPSDEIVILTADEAIYSRCLLHLYISGKRDVSQMSFVPSDFAETNNLDIRYNVTASSINADKKEVLTSSGTESYDKLLIATGATSIMPNIPGLKDAPNAYGLRNLTDAKLIRETAKNAKNIVILGAGLVGLDAVYGLLEMGKKPVVIGRSESILANNLDSKAALVYQQKFEEAGADIRLKSEIVKVESSHVILNCGDKVPYDLLIVAAGVCPDVGIWGSIYPAVNEYLSTEKNDIYAAGDVTGLSETWPNAIDQGEAAALNMVGVKTSYNDNFCAKNTINFFGIPTLSLGVAAPAGSDKVDVKETKENYQKVISRDGIAVGVLLQGDISRSGFWQQLIKRKVDISDIDRVSFASKYSVLENGEYEWK